MLDKGCHIVNPRCFFKWRDNIDWSYYWCNPNKDFLPEEKPGARFTLETWNIPFKHILPECDIMLSRFFD
jgi:hypothetical protein